MSPFALEQEALTQQLAALLRHNHKTYREQVLGWAEGRQALPLRLCLSTGQLRLLPASGYFDRLPLACCVFGHQLVEAEIARVRTVLTD